LHFAAGGVDVNYAQPVPDHALTPRGESIHMPCTRTDIGLTVSCSSSSRRSGVKRASATTDVCDPPARISVLTDASTAVAAGTVTLLLTSSVLWVVALYGAVYGSPAVR